MGWVDKNIDDNIANWLFNIKIQLPDRSLFQRDVRPDISVDYDALEEQLAEIPAVICFWDQLLAEQRFVISVLEAKKDAIRAEVASELFKESGDAGVKMPAYILKDLVNNDERMIELMGKMIMEVRKENKLRAVVSSLQRKAESLRSLAGFKREERRG